MKIARFQFADTQSYGILENQEIIDLPAMAEKLETSLPEKLEAFIADERALEIAEILLLKANADNVEAASFPLSELTS